MMTKIIEACTSITYLTIVVIQSRTRSKAFSMIVLPILTRFERTMSGQAQRPPPDIVRTR